MAKAKTLHVLIYSSRDGKRHELAAALLSAIQDFARKHEVTVEVESQAIAVGALRHSEFTVGPRITSVNLKKG